MNHQSEALGDASSTTGRLWANLAGRFVRMRSDLLVVALDIVLAASAFTAMLLLRYDGSVPDDGWSGLGTFLPLAVLTVVVSNLVWGLYGQLWRHASLYEALQLVKSGATVMIVLVAIEIGPRHVPISVVVTGTVAATFLMALLRFQSRLFAYRRTADQPGLGVVVIGAGDAGAALVSDMLHSPRAGFRPVAVLDEDFNRHGRSFMGVPVAGHIADLPTVVERTGASLAVFAMTNAPQETVRRAAAAAEEADIALKIVPGISSAMRGGVTLRDIRDVQIEDLLGREEIATDLDAVRAMLTGRRVLITGAGGSIGSEIARQVLACDPELLDSARPRRDPPARRGRRAPRRRRGPGARRHSQPASDPERLRRVPADGGVPCRRPQARPTAGGASDRSRDDQRHRHVQRARRSATGRRRTAGRDLDGQGGVPVVGDGRLEATSPNSW